MRPPVNLSPRNVFNSVQRVAVSISKRTTDKVILKGGKLRADYYSDGALFVCKNSWVEVVAVSGCGHVSFYEIGEHEILMSLASSFVYLLEIHGIRVTPSRIVLRTPLWRPLDTICGSISLIYCHECSGAPPAPNYRYKFGDLHRYPGTLQNCSLDDVVKCPSRT